MTEHALPALFAVFLWWSSTGVILYLDGLPQRTFRWSMAGATLLMAASFGGLVASAAHATVAGAWCAFSCGLLAWGWQQLAFYTGYLAGPRTHACPPGCGGTAHVRHAVEATLYHEMAIAATALLITTLTWGDPNQLGLWTFLLLWGMHLSAKLNVFLGVRNLNEEFFPDHLRYLESFLRRRPMNAFFPVSVLAGSALGAWLVVRAAAVETPAFEAVGYTFLATITILAVLEHGFMVLPLPAAKLWQWGLRSREPVRAEGAGGGSGSGERVRASGADESSGRGVPQPPAPPLRSAAP